MNTKKNILVAPLHWGLGHATRCIPIINALLKKNYEVTIGSDGAALELLRKEFPELPWVALPSYEINYPRNSTFFKLKLLLKLPEIKKVMAQEKKIVKKLIAEGSIQGIISDNRLGVRSKKVPSVFITHQLNVLSGNTSFFSSKLHQRIIKKFDLCWVPDLEGTINLSGILGHPKKINFPVKYIGPLSRMTRKEVPMKFDVLVLLSGPEPQRTLLEVKMLEVFLASEKKVFLVRGVVEASKEIYRKDNITIANFLQTKDLETIINSSDVVLSRSGYTTIMDLAAMEKDAFFIPTPGQYEQKYLAKELKNKGIVPSCSQKDFSLEKLHEIPLYAGLKHLKMPAQFDGLFGLFEGE